MIPTPVEFWTLNNTRVGVVAATTLLSGDGNDYYCDPGKIGQGWENAAGSAFRALSISPAPFNSAGAWSCSMWLRRPTWNNSSMGALQLRDDVDGATKLRIETQKVLTYNQVKIVIGGNTKTIIIPAATVLDWHHVCVVHSGANSQKIWIDGLLTNNTAPNPTPAATPYLSLTGGYMPTSMVGKVDAVGWWNTALSDAEAAELYNAGAGWEYTPPPDDTPDAFAFAHVTAADPSTVYVSDSQVITGMDAGTAVSIADGEYRINGGAWTAAAGTIDPGQTLELRGTSSAESEGVVTVSVTVGTVTVDWMITTKLIASVVTTILWGSTPDTSRILSSRIVRGRL